MNKKISFVLLLILLCYPVLTFSEIINLETEKKIEENYCGAVKGQYDTNISRCFGKTAALIGTLSSEDKNGQNIYFLERPQWGDRRRLSFPAKHNRFYVSPDEFGPDVPKIFVEFRKETDIQKFLKRQVRIVGKVNNKESTPFKCSGASGEQIIWSEKYPNNDYCIMKDDSRMIIVEAERIERYIPPETWIWVDHDLPKFKSKEIIKEGVTKTAKFMPAGINSDSDCFFLDSPAVKDQFKKIVLEGTENGYREEYSISNIEMTARGTLEKRVYDLGECGCHCPPEARCDCPPCGEHASECIAPEKIWSEKNDGIKYGVNWFAGYITNPNLEKKFPSPYTDLKYYLQYYRLPYVKVKDDNGKVIKTFEKMMFLYSQYQGDVLYHPMFDYVLIFKNESSHSARDDIFDRPIKLKVYGEKVKAEYCIRPLKGQEQCMPCSLILMEKIIDENGENIILAR